jgi:hypothetical protein
LVRQEQPNCRWEFPRHRNILEPDEMSALRVRRAGRPTRQEKTVQNMIVVGG